MAEESNTVLSLLMKTFEKYVQRNHEDIKPLTVFAQRQTTMILWMEQNKEKYKTRADYSKEIGIMVKHKE